MSKENSLDVKSPEWIKYSSTLLVKSATYQKISPETFVQIAQAKGNSFKKWTEVTDYGDAKQESKIVQDLLSTPEFKPKNIDKILKFLFDKMVINYSNLVICYMGKGAGFGVAVLGKIKKGDPIGIYAGLVKIGLEPSDCSWKLSTESGLCIVIDSKEEGNITRFFQHAFSARKEAYECAGGVSNFVNADFATANVSAKVVHAGGKIGVMFFAMRDLEENEIIYVDYCKNPYEDYYFYNRFGILQPLKNTEFTVVLKCNKVFEKGRELLSRESKSKTRSLISQASFTYSQLLKGEGICIQFKNSEAGLKIPTEVFLKEIIPTFNDVILTVEDNVALRKHPQYVPCVIAVLREKTGITWKYNSKSERAFVEFNQDIYNHLLAEGFEEKDIFKGRVKETNHIWFGKMMMYLDLKSEENLNKLAGLAPLVKPLKQEKQAIISFTDSSPSPSC